MTRTADWDMVCIRNPETHGFGIPDRRDFEVWHFKKKTTATIPKVQCQVSKDENGASGWPAEIVTASQKKDVHFRVKYKQQILCH